MRIVNRALSQYNIPNLFPSSLIRHTDPPSSFAVLLDESSHRTRSPNSINDTNDNQSLVNFTLAVLVAFQIHGSQLAKSTICDVVITSENMKGYDKMRVSMERHVFKSSVGSYHQQESLPFLSSAINYVVWQVGDF